MSEITTKQLSIIVPAYNMHNYLNQCLDSMICPEIMDELEVIIINDGSTDDTAEIANEYVLRYPNTFKLISKTNGGHGSALNCGLKKATGRYYRPIDGDDWVDSKVLAIVIEKLRSIDSDMVLTNFKKVYDDTHKEEKIRVKNVFNMEEIRNNKHKENESLGRKVCIYEKEYSFENDLFDFYPQYLFHFITYKTKLLKENGIAFTEKCFYDDMEYDLYPLPYVKTVTAIDRYFYHYRLGREGQSVSASSFIKHRDNRYTIVKNTTEYFVKNQDKIGPNVRKHLLDETLFRIERQYSIYLEMDDVSIIKNEMKSFDEMIKGIDQNIYKLSGTKTIKSLRRSNFSTNKIEKIKNDINEKRKPKPKPKAWSMESDIPMHREIVRRKILKYTGLAIFSKEMSKIRKYKNSHLGERCFITCPGPSMTIRDLELLNDETTFGVNSITAAYSQTKWRPTFYILVDIFAFARMLSNTKIEGGFCKDTAFFHYRVKLPEYKGNEIFCPIGYENHIPKWMEKKKIKVSSDISVCAYDCNQHGHSSSYVHGIQRNLPHRC